MERTLTLRLSAQMASPAMALLSKSASNRRQGKENFRNVMWSCGGPKDGRRGSGSAFSHCFVIHELQVRKFNTVPGRGNDSKRVKSANKRKGPACSVLNEMGQRSSKIPQGSASLDELKDQLEALQDEALQVRNRYNNARARFMRLTEAAHQLRQRASSDLNLGNEGNARKALIEKQKVIQAAELSKKRAQLLEEMSSKLDEAISVKETQLIVALSIPQREEPTVRVVSSKDHEVADSEDRTYAMKGEVVLGSRDTLVEEEKVSLAAELGYSIDRHLYGNEDDLEAEDLYGVLSPSGGHGVTNESYSESGTANPISRDSESDDIDRSEPGPARIREVDEPSISDRPEYGNDGSEVMGSAFLDTSLGVIGLSEQNEGRENSRGAGFHEERVGVLEDLILDVDREIAGVESRLQTVVSRSTDASHKELQLVRELLEHVQGLRARISEAAGSLPQQDP